MENIEEQKVIESYTIEVEKIEFEKFTNYP